MPLSKNKIIEQKQCEHFPIDKFGDIVICENDQTSEYEWDQYLKKIYPGKSIVTINFFDLKSEAQVNEYFAKAEIISFSTTFSKWEWFEKLTKCAKSKQVIGFSHDATKWEKALQINPSVKVIYSIK